MDQEELERAYAEAADEWMGSEDEALWESTVADGLDEAPVADET